MMDSKEKEKLIEKVNALITKEEYEEAADALVCSGDCREDYELSCLLAAVFNSMGDEKTERFFITTAVRTTRTGCISSRACCTRRAGIYKLWNLWIASSARKTRAWRSG